ncbi:hypothetical protein QYF61_000042 [Mycteria americana]|uniref:Rna-directed dna polymerase from mobile element jockey-like n=1 Tax=Mycteria americana TaxID=33587 RepID=A0AAN7S4T5_MYCAM|nr:hypothetical protein QYF61_000042 [Mycteria americana]
MKFNKGECKVLHLGRNNPVHQYMLGATQLESSLAEKDLEILVDTKLNRTKQCTLAAKKVNALGRPRLEICVQFWAPQYKRDIDILEKVQQRAMKMIKGLEHLSYEEGLR